MQNLKNYDKAKSQIGASMIEYALLVALVALIAIPSISMLGKAVDQTFTNATQALPGEGSIQCVPGSPIFPGCLAD